MSIGQQASHWAQSLLAASTLCFVSCDDSIHASYSTAAEARADGAIRRGWVPEVLPDSATGISEAHDLDTNTGSGSFQFDAVDADSFRARLRPATTGQVERFSDHQRLQSDGYTFHVASEFVFAINWDTRSVHIVLVLQT